MSPNIENLTNFKHKNVVATDYDTHGIKKNLKNMQLQTQSKSTCANCLIFL